MGSNPSASTKFYEDGSTVSNLVHVAKLLGIKAFKSS